MKNDSENVYVEIYEENYNTGLDILDSLLVALKQLKEDRESLKYNTEQFGLVSRILRGSFFQKKQYNAEFTKKNLEIIDSAIAKLYALKARSKIEGPGEGIAFRKVIQEALNEDIKSLSDSSKTKMFFKYVIAHLISIDHSFTDELQWTPLSIDDLLKSKRLPETIFDGNQNSSLSFESDIAEHAKWAFEHIYQYAYPHIKSEPAHEGIARFQHGIEHVARAAMYARVFANLYRKHGDEDAQNLTEDDLKLIQIALLFHDSARENEGVDHWDHESAILLYSYLTRVLHINPQAAKLCAEATANKDLHPEQGYFEIIENEDGEISWRINKYEESSFPPKNIFQKIIHDCDCLDIIRARKQFDSRYLDFYKNIASKKSNEIALEEMAELVIEARSLIAIQGDLHIKPQAKVKARYEQKEAYSKIVADLDPDVHQVLTALHNKLLPVDQLKNMKLVDLTPFDSHGEMTRTNLKAAMREGRIYARAIYSPSASPKPRDNKKTDADETLAEKEIRKTMRVADINTKSRKEGARNKYGNPLRSVSILGGGSNTYGPAGMLIFEPDATAVRKVSAEDFDSGRGKKKHLIALQRGKEASASSKLLISKELDELQAKIKLGLFGRNNQEAFNYAEILYDITQYTAIFYNPDPTLANAIATKDFESTHKQVPFLQAVYIQRQYEIQYEHTREAYMKKYGEEEGLVYFRERFGSNSKLPVYEYSGLHNRLTLIDPSELTDEKIIRKWVEMCSDYMTFTSSKVSNYYSSLYYRIYSFSIDEIKILSMFKQQYDPLNKRQNQPADMNYPVALREKVSKAIQQERQRLTDEHEQNLIEKINNNILSIFSEELFLNLQYSPGLRELSSKQIKEQVVQFINSEQTLSTELLSNLVFNGDWSVVSINNLNDFNQLSFENKKKIASNKLLITYLLAKQLGLDREVSLIQNKACEAVRELSLRWRTDDMVSITLIINLNTLMTLIGCDDEINKIIEPLLLDFWDKNTNQLVAEQCCISEYISDIELLQNQKLLRPEYEELMRKGFSRLNHMSTIYEMTFYMELAQLLNENPLPGFDIWLKNTSKIYYNSELFILLKKNIIFNDEHLGRFEALVEKVYFADHPTVGTSLSLWMREMDYLETLVEGNKFSESQLEIIKKRFDAIIALDIKEILTIENVDLNSNLNKNEKKVEMLLTLCTEINTILKRNFFLPVPDRLEHQFTTILKEQTDESFIDFKLGKEQICTITQLHEQLPNQKVRQVAIEKLIEYSKTQNNLEEETEQSNLPGLK